MKELLKMLNELIKERNEKQVDLMNNAENIEEFLKYDKKLDNKIYFFRNIIEIFLNKNFEEQKENLQQYIKAFFNLYDIYFDIFDATFTANLYHDKISFNCFNQNNIIFDFKTNPDKLKYFFDFIMEYKINEFKIINFLEKQKNEKEKFINEHVTEIINKSEIYKEKK